MKPANVKELVNDFMIFLILLTYILTKTVTPQSENIYENVFSLTVSALDHTTVEQHSALNNHYLNYSQSRIH